MSLQLSIYGNPDKRVVEIVDDDPNTYTSAISTIRQKTWTIMDSLQDTSDMVLHKWAVAKAHTLGMISQWHDNLCCTLQFKTISILSATYFVKFGPNHLIFDTALCRQCWDPSKKTICTVESCQSRHYHTMLNCSLFIHALAKWLMAFDAEMIILINNHTHKHFGSWVTHDGSGKILQYTESHVA